MLPMGGGAIPEEPQGKNERRNRSDRHQARPSATDTPEKSRTGKAKREGTTSGDRRDASECVPCREDGAHLPWRGLPKKV